MRTDIFRWGSFTLIGLILLSFAVLSLEGVPSFARKYRTSCATCHVAFPALNPFGRAFRNNGYRMPGGDENWIEEEPSPLGAPASKRVWPETIWPADIPGGSVAGFILESNYTVNRSEVVSNEFDGIEEIGLLLGGTVGESLSFFGDVDLFEEGKPGGIGRLFLQYNHPSALFNFRAGQIEPRVAPFSNHRRLTRISNYLMNVFPTIPAQNFFGFSPNQKGIELYGSKEGPGQKGGFTWAFGVVNGEFGGAAEALEESAAVEELLEELEEFQEEFGGEFDANSEKDFYASFEYKIAGMGVLGSGVTPEQGQNWVDDSLTLGVYFYRGISPVLFEAEGEEGEEIYGADGNEFFRTGMKADIFLGNLNVFGGLQLNEDALQLGPKRKFRSTIGMAETRYVMYPWLIPAYRFENVNPNFGLSFQRHTFTASVLVRANAKLLLEFVKSDKDAPPLPPFDDRFRVGFNMAF
ncbi:hypothetical protein MYX82_02005 [Acidobacteria bacterium AH-259-D05]|nr:hypothetical protein [Acidobacteria bacterium AH-259-D05]